ncbi:MAG: toll/interleukin-1 receptor domain-containing protein, partial [Promethearchaeia archaeon]
IMDHAVFISFAQENQNIAEKIYELLENKEIKCWISSRDILPGEDYPKAIISAIKASRILLVVVSEFSNKSTHVKRELERAINRKIPIIPIRIEDVKLSEAMEYYISTPQWLDASTSPIEHHIPKLIKSIKAKLINADELAQKAIDEKDTILGIKEDVNVKAESIKSATEALISTPLNIYFSYSIRDVEAFKLPEIATQLKQFDGIRKAYLFHTRSSSLGQKNPKWKSYLKKSNLLIVFSTLDSNKSKSVKKELDIANDMKIPIIPVFKDQKYLPESLNTRAGVEFDVYNLKNTINELYNRIVEEIASKF